MNKLTLMVLLLCFACSTDSAVSPFDEADNLEMSRDQRRVRELFLKASETDPDPERRDVARVRAARIDWYVLRDAAAARVGLAKVDESGRTASTAHSERSRLECELVHDFDAAKKAADLALASAGTQGERDEALTRAGAAAVERARLERSVGKCAERVPLDGAIATLMTAIKGSGPTVERMTLLLDAALIAHDDAAALQAWRWYHSNYPALVPASLHDRRAAGLALAAARLFPEAELVLRDPCASTPIPDDTAVRDVLTYAMSMRRVSAIAAEHYRSVAAGTSNDRDFNRALDAEAKSLWAALSWTGPTPPFSREALQAELARRFGAVITLGETGGIFDLLYGHRLADETREVQQYGHRGSLHFVQLDGITSGGYAAWATHGSIGTGGWIGDDAIYQVRPMYVDSPLDLWRRTNDPIERARAEEEIRSETKRDLERAKGGTIVALPGLTLRLRQQYGDQLRDRLVAEGLQGDALRDAFLRTATADKLASSIWAHEGRHSIDKSLGISKDVELEFRAKLSEVVLAPAPRGALGAILSPVGGKSAHGAANKRVLEGVAGWIAAHAREIGGIDSSAPPLAQLDRLTDGQLRAAFRSLDPLAR